jgi:hypothetical protein
MLLLLLVVGMVGVLVVLWRRATCLPTPAITMRASLGTNPCSPTAAATATSAHV